MNLLLLSVLFFASAEPLSDQLQFAPSAEIRIVDDRMEFRGLITEESSARVLDMYDAAMIKPTVFLIESNGGASRAAIKLGNFIFDAQLDVEVDTYCHSSCANYVFTAGRTKTVSRTASLVWHGGAKQPISSPQIENLLESTLSKMDSETRTAFLQGRTKDDLLEHLHRSLQELIELETRFFARIGIDQRITTLGFSISPPPLASGRYIGWDYSLADLATLGLHGLIIKDGESWVPHLPWKSTHIYRVSLSEIPDFRPQNSEYYLSG
jgi:hypothetical protein